MLLHCGCKWVVLISLLVYLDHMGRIKYKVKSHQCFIIAKIYLTEGCSYYILMRLL